MSSRANRRLPKITLTLLTNDDGVPVAVTEMFSFPGAGPSKAIAERERPKNRTRCFDIGPIEIPGIWLRIVTSVFFLILIHQQRPFLYPPNFQDAD